MYCNKISSYTKQPNKKSYISSLQTPLKKQNFSKKSEICPSAGYSPNTPPRFAGLGCDPGYPLGIIILFPRIVESQIYGYDKHTQIPADFHPRRV